jgi:hypothetical protein
LALLTKRRKHSARNVKFLFSSLALPALLIALSMCLAMLRPSTQLPALLLTPSLYGPQAFSFARCEIVDKLIFVINN